MITGWATMTTIIVIVGWIILFVLLFIVPANRKPSSATAWLLLAFLLPYLGVLLFLLLGSPKLSRRRRTGRPARLRRECRRTPPAQPGGHADVLRPAGGCEPPPDRGRLPVQVQTGEP